MCARYYMDRELYDDVESVVGHVPEQKRYKGDIHPSESPMVIVGSNKPQARYDVAWGYPGKNQKGLIINARSETVEEKSVFRRGIAKYRCLLPARAFYEWDSDKNKVTFFAEDKKTIFLAGCYDVFQGQRRFVIITTAANDSMIQVHDRMPLMIDKADIEDWLMTDRYHELLQKPMPKLNKHQEYEQLRLMI